ncbi:MAG: DEAD/DEAH box helicase family protein [Egibacteraceae bacterium]
MVQSLVRHDDLERITARYGLVVVDECQHVPAATVESCVRRIPARRWVGLTATPYPRTAARRSWPCTAARSAMRWPPRPARACASSWLSTTATTPGPATRASPSTWCSEAWSTTSPAPSGSAATSSTRWTVGATASC